MIRRAFWVCYLLWVILLGWAHRDDPTLNVGVMVFAAAPLVVYYLLVFIVRGRI